MSEEQISVAAEPPVSEQDLRGVSRGISRCWQNSGYHVYGAGPCFDTFEQAQRYRDSLDREGVTWRRQP